MWGWREVSLYESKLNLAIVPKTVAFLKHRGLIGRSHINKGVGIVEICLMKKREYGDTMAVSLFITTCRRHAINTFLWLFSKLPVE